MGLQQDLAGQALRRGVGRVGQVGCQRQRLAARGAGEGDHVRVAAVQHLQVAVSQRRVLSAQRDQTAVEVEHGQRVGHLGLGVDVDVVGVHLQPRRAGGEARVGGGVPLHRRAGVVPAQVGGEFERRFGRIPGQQPLAVVVVGADVVVLVDGGEVDAGHAQLLALIHEGRAGAHVVHQRQRLGADLPEFTVVAEERHLARLVVVAHELGPPAAGDDVVAGLQPVAQHGGDVLSVLGDGRKERDRHVELGALVADVVGQLLVAAQRHLAHGHQVQRREQLLVQLVQIGVGARPPGEQAREHIAVGHGRALGVGEVGGLVQIADGVDAQAVHAPVLPPADQIVDLGLQRGTAPVQVGLLFGEVVQVILAALLVEFPGAAAEAAGPVVGRVAVHRVAPVVVIGVRGLPLHGFAEPLVLVGGVVHHQIEYELHAAGVALADQLVAVRHRPELGQDGAVVGYVVAVVVVGRGEERREPQRVDAQLRKVVQLGDDAGQVAHAVAVGIEKAARVDLVDHQIAHPVLLWNHGFALLCMVFVYCITNREKLPRHFRRRQPVENPRSARIQSSPSAAPRLLNLSQLRPAMLRNCPGQSPLKERPPGGGMYG